VVKGAQAIPWLARMMQTMQAARPLASAVVPGVVSGGALGALEPVESGGSREANAAAGGLAGGAGGLAGRFLAKIVGGKSAGPADEVLKDGVRLTPGRALGGAYQRVEEGMESIPIVGDMIKKSHRRAIEDFNRAAINRVLDPIAERLEKGQPVGREAIAFVESRLGNAYDKVLGKIKRVDLDNQFADEVGKVTDMVQTLPPDLAKQFDKIVTIRVLDKLTPAGTMSAETMKAVESDLGRIARGLRSNADMEKRQLGDAITEIQQSLRGAVERSAPEHAGELKAVNEAYAKFVRVQRAAASVTDEGVFSPAQLVNSVKASDGSVRKGAFARGDALMQDFAENAKSVLGSKVPDSGTPFRVLTAAGLGGGASYLGADPEHIAGVGALALPYTRAGRAATLAAIAKRPELAREIAALMARASPGAGIVSGAAYPSLTSE
jgi:hypothetical protein